MKRVQFVGLDVHADTIGAHPDKTRLAESSRGAMELPVTATLRRTPVVIIDEYLVDRYFADRDPLGQQIRRGGPDSPAFTIVGVVGTVNSIDLGEPVTKERLYYPVTQQARAGMTLMVKATVDPGSLAPQLQSVVQAIDPERPTTGVRLRARWQRLPRRPSL